MATRSHCSSSKSSRLTSTSSVSASAIKAWAAQAEVSYTTKEASVLKEKVCLTPDSACKDAVLQEELHVLKLKRKAAAALVKADVLEAAIGEGEKPSCKEENIPVPCYSPTQHTSEYVQSLAHEQSSQATQYTRHFD